MSGPDHDVEQLVVVPRSAGPVRPLSDVDRPRDEIDSLVDDMFGEVDDQGPSTTDGILLAGGVGAIVASQILVLPGLVLGGGIAAAGIGAILPVRSVLRRLKRARRKRKIASVIGDGQLLDVSDELTVDLLDVYASVLKQARQHNQMRALRASNVAHGLLDEVVSLLDGRPVTSAEHDYVHARLAAMRGLNSLLAATDEDAEPRQAVVAARLELEAAATSALADAEELTEDWLSEVNRRDDI